MAVDSIGALAKDPLAALRTCNNLGVHVVQELVVHVIWIGGAAE